MVTNSKNSNPFSVRIYFLVLLILIIAGISISGYLSYSHYKIFTDIEYTSFCAISKSINCETVSQSKHAVLLGIPVAVWGLFGYLLLIPVLIYSIDYKNNQFKRISLFVLLAFFYSTIGVVLSIISSVLIQAYCLMCIGSWTVNLALLYISWLIHRRYETDGFFFLLALYLKNWKKNQVKVISCALLMGTLLIGLLIFYPKYWDYQHSEIIDNISTGITNQGYPWIGADDPVLTISVFTDYRCFQCKKTHFYLKNLVKQYPTKLRVIHRHFPMDHKFNPMVNEPLHPGSGILALVAITAIDLNKYWQANDYLYNYEVKKNNLIWLRQIAKDLEIELSQLVQGVNSKNNRAKLRFDILFGIKSGFSGTPSFIINDQVYMGHIPKEIIQLLKD